jgi:SAM-dependent methyltransferase
MASDTYLLDNEAAEAELRFAALSAVFDEVTLRHVDALGIAPGWQCWAVGAGGPSIPDALAARVAPGGRVVASDLDPRWLAGRAGSGVEVIQHDVAHDDPPGDGFDLVHARLVLIHVVEREEALRRMVSALRPGGWLLIEDYDTTLLQAPSPDEEDPDQRLVNEFKAEFRELLYEREADPRFGRRLPRLMREAGLADVRADGYFALSLPAVAAIDQANARQIREGIVRRGRLSAADVDRYLELVASGRVDLTTPALVSAWGRRAA